MYAIKLIFLINIFVHKWVQKVVKILVLKVIFSYKFNSILFFKIYKNAYMLIVLSKIKLIFACLEVKMELNIAQELLVN